MRTTRNVIALAFPRAKNRILAPSLFVIALIAMHLPSAAVRAQDSPKAQPASAAPALAGYVPAAAGVFLEIDRLPALIGKQQNRAIWTELLRGNDDSGWRKLLADALGGRSENTLLRLARGQIAVAAPDWDRLADGMLIFAGADPRAVKILAGGDGLDKAPLTGSVKTLQTRAGWWLAMRNDIVVLARQRGPNTLFEGAIDLLNGAGTSPLTSREDFQRRLKALPDTRDGVAFWAAAATGEDDEASDWWPPRTTGAVSFAVDTAHISATLNASTQPGETPAPPPRIVLDRLMKLPQMTLFAYATSVDVRAGFDYFYTLPPSPELQQLWDRIESSLDASKFENDVIANLGPRCVFFLSPNYERDDLAPQAGLLIESLDSTAVVAGLYRMAERLAETLTAGPDDEHRVHVATTEYLDTEIHTLVWPRQASTDAPYTLADLLVEHIHPSVASVDGWLVVATSPELVQQIVDVRRGFAPQLGEAVHLSAHSSELRRAIRAAVVQPALAQNTLRLWDGLLRSRRREANGRARLGITLQADDTPGQALVADVTSNGPAAGRLAPGDGIVACNGVLLSMDDANRHLQKILASAPPRASLKLRVRRGVDLLETEIPQATDEALPQTTVLSALLVQIAPLERIATQVTAAVYAVERPGRDSYHARVMLDLVQPVRPTTASPPPEETAAIPPE